jgi:hypothetical protein
MKLAPRHPSYERRWVVGAGYYAVNSPLHRPQVIGLSSRTGSATRMRRPQAAFGWSDEHLHRLLR